jgi:hypothetical protein
MILPSGGFFTLGVLLLFINRFNHWQQQHREQERADG